MSAGSPDEDDSTSQASEDTPARRSEHEQIKRDLLMGHLLSLVTQSSPSGLPSHALPALAASLSGKGLMPKWVQWSLTHQPALFNKAFERLFSEVSSAQHSPQAFYVLYTRICPHPLKRVPVSLSVACDVQLHQSSTVAKAAGFRHMPEQQIKAQQSLSRHPFSHGSAMIPPSACGMPHLDARCCISYS